MEIKIGRIYRIKNTKMILAPSYIFTRVFIEDSSPGESQVVLDALVEPYVVNKTVETLKRYTGMKKQWINQLNTTPGWNISSSSVERHKHLLSEITDKIIYKKSILNGI